MTETQSSPDPAGTFRLLWDSLSDLIGSSATATLVRRAAKHATAGAPLLGGLQIAKRTFEYELAVPAQWSADDLRALLAALQPLLVELTGLIVINRLRGIPALAGMLVEDARE